MNRTNPIFLAGLALIVSLAGCGGGSETADTSQPDPASENQDESATFSGTQTDESPSFVSSPGETPEATFGSFKKAATAKDWKTATSLLALESQQRIAGSSIMMSKFLTKGSKEKAESRAALLKKHGVEEKDAKELAAATDPMAAMAEMVKNVKDIPALVGEVETWSSKNKTADRKAGLFLDVGSLSEVTVDGDSASATAETKRTGPQVVEFIKVDGGWLMQLPSPKPRGAGSADNRPPTR